MIGREISANCRTLLSGALCSVEAQYFTMGRDLLPIHEARTPATQSTTVGSAKDLREPATRPDQASVRRSLEDIEKEHILRVLESTDGIIDGPTGAAQILALHASTLRAR